MDAIKRIGSLCRYMSYHNHQIIAENNVSSGILLTEQEWWLYGGKLLPNAKGVELEVLHTHTEYIAKSTGNRVTNVDLDYADISKALHYGLIEPIEVSTTTLSKFYTPSEVDCARKPKGVPLDNKVTEHMLEEAGVLPQKLQQLAQQLINLYINHLDFNPAHKYTDEELELVTKAVYGCMSYYNCTQEIADLVHKQENERLTGILFANYIHKERVNND